MKKFGTFLTLCAVMVSNVAFAESFGGGADNTKGMIALAAGLGLSLAAFGAALAQGKIAAAALEGIARNPGAQGKIQTPMILGLAFAESLVIFTFVVAFLLQNKV